MNNKNKIFVICLLTKKVLDENKNLNQLKQPFGKF